MRFKYTTLINLHIKNAYFLSIYTCLLGAIAPLKFLAVHISIRRLVIKFKRLAGERPIFDLKPFFNGLLQQVNTQDDAVSHPMYRDRYRDNKRSTSSVYEEVL